MPAYLFLVTAPACRSYSSTMSELPRKALRTRVVSFLNARPLYHSLQDPDKAPRWADGSPMFELQTALPSECGKALAAGECDLALVPVGSFVEHPEWEIVPGIAIASRGAVSTVVVVGECPLQEMRVLHLDEASRSSALLIRLILKEMGLNPQLSPLPHGEGAAKAKGDEGALIIGDAAFGLSRRFAHCYDLGELWFQRTGLPFVFALWAAKPGVIEPAHIEALSKARDRSLTKFAERIAQDYFDQEFAPKLRGALNPGFPEHRVHFFSNYLRKTIQFGLETQHREGLAEFLGRVQEAGLGARGSDEEVHVQFAGKGLPEELARARKRRSEAMSCDPLLQKAAQGERLDLAEGIFLYENADHLALGQAADARRQTLHPDNVVTYIIDRNVNYTNYCVTRCKFCNFYVPPGAKKGGYVLSKEELAKKFRETEELGGIQILLQGGLNPDLDLAYYEDLFSWTKENFELNLHALSPTEILHIAQIEDLSIREVLIRLQTAGMGSLPGGGAEILDDEVRNRISPFKNNTEEWLEVMRQAHRLGMRSSASMVFGFQESNEQLLLHLDRLRSLQDEHQGFTAFITWPFQAEGTRLKLRDDTSAQRYLRIQALARLYLDNIASIQVSWPTLGPEVGEMALRFGANDFGSVMIEENVVSQAGASFMMSAEDIERHIHYAGFKAARRNVHYQRLTEPA